MVGLYGGEPTGHFALEEMGSDAVSSGTGAGAAFSEGLALNPFGRITRQIARTTSESNIFAADPMMGFPLQPEQPLDPETANRDFGIPGVLSFDQPVTPTVARDLFEAKRAKIERDDTIARSEGGLVAGTARIGAALGASLLDPINVAAGFIPIIGPAREAALIAQASGAVGRAGIRASVGAGAGAVGMAALQPLEFALSAQEREDYTMADAMRSIALGTVLGGGLHAGVGGAIDRATGRYRNPIAQRIEDAGPDARETALRGALAQVTEGRPVDVAPVFDAVDAVRGVDAPAVRGAGDDMFAAARREPEPQARVMADEAIARPNETLETIRQEIADLERMSAPPETPVARAGAPEAADSTQRAAAAEQAPAARPERPAEADLAADLAEARAAAVDRAALCITRAA